ncbi:N-lysine methyltransferase SMYD2 [Madurella mycetomatis]|uniref:N-lysine methyltransferase SMYD2 n=1 Tax=Madurella mycetomatis TaxID=100816 RepID=A0A175W4F7_9PEZI|nr:N-lysine methyltransferase SMYD2 [Madurella mycetomatis]
MPRFIIYSLLHILLTSRRVSAQSDLLGGQAISQCTNNFAGPFTPRPDQLICPPLVDNETAVITGSWSPWSIPPACLGPKKKGGSKLCTFTSFNHWAGGGLSIITTPEVAAGVARFLHDPDIPWLENERGSPFKTDGPKPFEVKEFPGKGFGVIATEFIRKNQVLMLGLPIMLQLSESNRWGPHDVLKLLHRAANQLPSKEREEMRHLSRQGKGYILDDIMRTNTFDVSVDGVSHSGLYPEIARINHACKPNCFTRYSTKTLVMEVVAYKDIEPGEELSLSYTPLNILSTDRRDMIQFWGFNCTCALCSNAQAIKTSDRQRRRIQKILEDLDDSANHTPEKVSAATTEVEGLVVEEGMTGQMGDLYSIIANVYLTMGDLKMARSYGKLAVKLLRWYAGFDSARTESAQAFMVKLEGVEHQAAQGSGR